MILKLNWKRFFCCLLLSLTLKTKFKFKGRDLVIFNSYHSCNSLSPYLFQYFEFTYVTDGAARLWVFLRLFYLKFIGYENNVFRVDAIYHFLLFALLNPMINFEAMLHSMHCGFFSAGIRFLKLHMVATLEITSQNGFFQLWLALVNLCFTPLHIIIHF